MSLKETISKLWATWFYTGLSKKAPGTVGSFFALPIAYLVSWYGSWGVFLFCVFIFLTGWKASEILLRHQEDKDPGFVVIDEVLGQTLAFIFITSDVISSPILLLLGFALFRFFDIVKIWPACWFDQKMHTALGVMLDDAVAGFYAALVLYVGHVVLF